MSIYVSHGFSQVIINCLGLLISGFIIESMMGSFRFIIFYFVAGISANLFAAATDSWYATGAEPVLFA